MPSPSGNIFPVNSFVPLNDLIPNSNSLQQHVAQDRQLRDQRSQNLNLENAQELKELHFANRTTDTSTNNQDKRRYSAGSLHLDVNASDSETDSPHAPLLTTDSEGSDTEALMGRRKASPRTKDRQTNGHSIEGDSHHQPNGNGHATSTDMESSLLEQRRKRAHESPTSEHLMSRSNFSLDDTVPAMGEEHVNETKSRGFSELGEKDKKNFLLLVLLYFLQGVPMGLAMGSVPFLLKQHVSYTQMGVFSLASYPYSLKLLWSPIVDALWNRRIGRRKSWILPIQTMSGIGMLWLARHAEAMMNHAAENDGQNVWGFTWWWFGLVFMCATQDIAVDGWALTLLSPENLSYASTAQTVGLTAGQFLSSTIFLAFNSKDFANKWFRAVPLETGLISLGSALSAAGWLYLIVTVGLAIWKHEDLHKSDEGVWDVYKVMFGILKLRHVQTLIVVHLVAKIGFQANDGATMMKLLDKGFGQDNLSLTVLIDFPFEIGLGYYVGKWSSVYGPMELWSWAFMGRLAAALLGQFIVWTFPIGGVTTGYMLLVIIGHVFSTFTNTVMFVAVSAFHARIADPVYGGTYMTLLATVSNLGGTFPKFFILQFIDMFTVASCTPPGTPPKDFKGDLITAPFSCVLEPEKARCIAGGGTCRTTTDGYNIMNIICVLIGVLTFWGYIRPAVKKLEKLPTMAWRLNGQQI